MSNEHQKTQDEDNSSLENGNVSASFRKELEKAMDEMDDTKDTATPADDSPEETKDAGTPAEPEKGGDGGDPAPFSPDDALVERAVKAGLSLADARSFTSQDVMERVCAALESKSAKPADDPSGRDGADTAAADGEDTGIDQIPELSEDEDYDPKLVSAFNGMKKLLAAQQQTIAKLLRAGASARAEDAFGKLTETLDESVRRSLDAASRSSLRKKYDVLAAGYKAANADMTDADIFKEAAELVLGDRIRKAAAETRAESLEKRKSLRLAAPGGEQGARRAQSGEDADREIAAILERKYGA